MKHGLKWKDELLNQPLNLMIWIWQLLLKAIWQITPNHNGTFAYQAVPLAALSHINIWTLTRSQEVYLIHFSSRRLIIILFTIIIRCVSEGLQMGVTSPTQSPSALTLALIKTHQNIIILYRLVCGKMGEWPIIST